MCKKRSSATIILEKRIRIDKCMKNIILCLNDRGIDTLACCCGHGIYPMTIICKGIGDIIYELFTAAVIPRKKRFYFRDKEGIFFIPEVVKEK